jgi:hypothetical protein
MPWWAVVYFTMFCALSVAGIWDDCRDRRPTWFLGCAIVSNVIIAYLFVAYWQPTIRVPLGSIASVAFVATMCWELFQASEDIRALHTAPEISRAITVITAIAYPVICSPAFIVAGLAAFRA